MLTGLGKLLIVVSLVFQAYVLFENQTVAKQFNNKLLAALETCDCIPDHIAGHILEHGRFIVIGLLGSSALMLLLRSALFKITTIIGLSVLLYIEHQPFTKIPCIGCSRLWQKVAVIGAIIYLMAADCAASSCKKVCGTEKKTEKAHKA